MRFQNLAFNVLFKTMIYSIRAKGKPWCFLLRPGKTEARTTRVGDKEYLSFRMECLEGILCSGSTILDLTKKRNYHLNLFFLKKSA